jgi:hypothetical protein
VPDTRASKKPRLGNRGFIALSGEDATIKSRGLLFLRAFDRQPTMLWPDLLRETKVLFETPDKSKTSPIPANATDTNPVSHRRLLKFPELIPSASLGMIPPTPVWQSVPERVGISPWNLSPSYSSKTRRPFRRWSRWGGPVGIGSWTNKLERLTGMILGKSTNGSASLSKPDERKRK